MIKRKQRQNQEQTLALSNGGGASAEDPDRQSNASGVCSTANRTTKSFLSQCPEVCGSINFYILNCFFSCPFSSFSGEESRVQKRINFLGCLALRS